VASDPLIHYRRIPGTRRYYNPKTYQTISDRQVQNYRKSLTPNQREDIRVQSRRVGTASRRKRGDLLSTFQRKLDYEETSYTASERARFANLYARLQQISLQEREWIGLPEYADELEDLRDPDGEYADILVELGRRDPDSEDPVGSSPPGTASALYT
jgi:hypothetical protein